MNSGLRDLIGHHAWATAQLIDFCRALDPAELDATVTGTYGTVIQTLQHVIDSDASYAYRLTGAWPAAPWQDDAEVGLAVLAERAAEVAAVVERYVLGEWDDDRLGEARGDDGAVFAVSAGVFLTQFIHHANEHRAHVCTILGARGYEPPDVSAWGYAEATGRSWITTPPTR